MRVQAFLLEFCGGGEDGAILGLGNQREGNVQTYATVTHHRVDLVEALAAFLNFLHGNAKVLCKFFLLVFALRYELMERRVKETEHDGLAIHHAEGFLHCSLHVGLKLCEGGLALFICVAEDHLAELGERLL